MKTIVNKPILFNDKPVIDENQKPHTTYSLIKAILENSAYASSAEIIKASSIISKLRDEDELSFDDEDFGFVKRLASQFPPTISKGLVFLEFYQILENNIKS